MSTNVVDFRRIHLGHCERLSDGPDRTRAILGRRCNMKCIGCLTIADNFGQDLSAARLGEFQLLENHHSRALPGDQPVAIHVKGRWGVARPHRGGPGLFKAAQGYRRDDCLAAAGDDSVKLAIVYRFEGLSNRVTSRGTGGCDGRAGPKNSIVNCQHTGRAIGHDLGDGERAQAPCAGLMENRFLSDEGANSTNSRANTDSDALPIGVIYLQSRLLPWLDWRPP